MKIDKILEIRELISDAFQRLEDSARHFPSKDFERYCISMDLIDDTGSAVWSHMREDFSREPMRAYIEFWGVMQAIFIQQDAICELHDVVVRYRPSTSTGWKELRNIRNLCVGHPANRGPRKSPKRRTAMGRHFGNYDDIRFISYDEHRQKRTFRRFNLRKMIEDYDKEAGSILNAVLNRVRQLAADENAPAKKA